MWWFKLEIIDSGLYNLVINVLQKSKEAFH